MREGLVEFLCRNYPESLPRQRSVDEPPDEEVQRRRKLRSPSAAQGKEHERGPKAPGIHAEPESDGAGRSFSPDQKRRSSTRLEKQNRVKHTVRSLEKSLLRIVVDERTGFLFE